MNVFDLMAKITLDTSDYDKGLDDASKQGNSFAGKLKSGLKTAAKVGAVALGAAAAGVATLTKASIANYAEYEQLVGGVETLFEDNAGTIIDYADRAYRTAGMSANQYMETITSFSASLLQSVGGDTEKAAEIADRAITDMSDNANKMGTSIESIQYAYQGFAKQNYTMLDNLKLGYGGTKEEMERLINDAAKMTDVQKELGIEVEAGNMSFANIANAISVVQKEMGIMGTTSAEASSTIQGSISSMQAAWSNLLTAISGDGWDVGVYMQNFVDAVVTAAGNIIPRIGVVLQNIGPLIAGLAPIIAEQLPGLIETLVPSVIQAAASLIGALVQNLPAILSSLFTAISSVVDSLIGGLGEQFPFLTSLLNTLKDVIPVVVAAFVAYEAITKAVAIAQGLLNAVLNANPFVLIISLLGGAVLALKTLWDTNEGFRTAVQNIWSAITGFFTGAWDTIRGVWDKVTGFFGGIWNGIKDTFSGVKGWFSEKFTSAKEAASNAWSNVKSKFGEHWNNIKGAFSEAGGWFSTNFQNFRENALNAWSNIKSRFSDVWSRIKSAFSIGDALSWGRDMLQNFINGIGQKIGALVDKVKGIGRTIKNFLGFSEPKEGPLSNFHTYAPDMMKLFAKGIADNEDVITNQLEKSFAFQPTISSAMGDYRGSGSYGAALSGATFNITVNGANIQDDQSLAERIAFEIQQMVDRKEAVFGAA